MKKRIAFISEHASPLALLGGVDSGGQNVYVDQLAKHLAKRGYEVDIFTRWEDANLPKVVEYLPYIRVIHVEAGPIEKIKKEEIYQYMDQFSEDMSYFVTHNKINYGLIHAHFWMSGYVAAHLKNTLGVPYVITFHALGKIRRIHQKESDGFPDERFDIEEMVAREADRVIAECPQDMDDLIKHYNASEEKITIVPCGFDKEEFFPLDKKTTKKKLGLDQKEKIVLQLGRMVPRKGVDTVIKSIAQFKKLSQMPVRLLIVGGESEIPDPNKTPEIGRLQELAKSIGVEQNITFVGSRSRKQLKYYYSAADVFVSTPWYEPFGITPLESMACGTPVIGSNVGGIKYSVEKNRTGLLVEPKDEKDLANKLNILLNNPKITKEMSRESIKRVNTLFTWEKVAQQMDEVYKEVVPQNDDVSLNELLEKALVQINESF